MIYVLLHDELVELPTARTLLEVDGHISFMDEAGLIVARFDKFDVIAYSAKREKVDLLYLAEAASLGQVVAVYGRGKWARPLNKEHCHVRDR